MGKIFVTGTGTDVGKTIVSAALLQGLKTIQSQTSPSTEAEPNSIAGRRHFDESNENSPLSHNPGLRKLEYNSRSDLRESADAFKSISYYKPIQTGGSNIDLLEIQKLLNFDLKSYPSHTTNGVPLSPDQANRIENKPEISLQSLLDHTKEIDSSEETVVIEGAGGIQVPINSKPDTWVDYLRLSKLPCLIVGDDTLGIINYASLTIKLLEANGVRPLGLILNNSSTELNRDSIRNLHPNLPIYLFPKINDFQNLENWENESTNLARFVSKELDNLTQILPQDDQMKSEFSSKNHGTLKHRNHKQTANQKDQGSEKSQWDQVLKDDLKYCWHPYTQHQTNTKPLIIKSALGINVELDDGTKLVDGSSSWWVNTIGHGNPEIGEAIRKQQHELDHTIFAGATHKPGATLARKIIEFSDSHLQRVFFSDNGSTAIEVALKMAYQASANRGQEERTQFLGFRGSYHGDTLGAMAVAKADDFHRTFEKLFFKTIWATPATVHKSKFCPNGLDDLDERIKELRNLISANHRTLAGIIIEPMIQGAGGMLIQPKEYLQEIEALGKEYSIPIIFDEVFSGMGRTGAPFAFKRAGVKPDIICLAKGLTGGNLPLALTLSTEDIFDAFLAEDSSKALLHGHSYTANPIACSAALKTLEIVEAQNLIQRSRDLESLFSDWGTQAEKYLRIENPRAIGAILAFELPGTGFGNYFYEGAKVFVDSARKFGLLLRTLGNTVYFVPPLSITDQEANEALSNLSLSIDQWKSCMNSRDSNS